ncbi:MAG TPA: thiopeptide-type bacteriocin biosynthesis protein [Niastella sp.]
MQQYEWLSLHLFYTGSAEKILCTIIQPFLKRVQPLLHPDCAYFFIRYAEDGLHIRLRLHTRINQLQVVKTMLEADLYDSGITMKPVPYVQEIQRYGNPFTIQIAESLFHASAVCSLECMAAADTSDVQAALLAACQMNLSFLYALNEDPKTVKQICTRFVQAWLHNLAAAPDNPSFEKLNNYLFILYNRQAHVLQPMALTLWRRLQEAQAPSALQTYANACRPLLQQYKNTALTEEAFHYALRSLLHMTHNRLGLPNKEEAWCVFITEQCLQYIYEQA